MTTFTKFYGTVEKKDGCGARNKRTDEVVDCARGIAEAAPSLRK
jgi:hypothetical protein